MSNSAARHPNENAAACQDANGRPLFGRAFGGHVGRQTEGCSRDQTSGPVNKVAEPLAHDEIPITLSRPMGIP